MLSRKVSWPGLCIALLIMSATVTLGQESQRAGQFRLRLSVLQNTISVAEPLRLLMEATAEGEPFTGVVIVQPEAGRGSVVVHGPAGETRYSMRDLLCLVNRAFGDTVPPPIFPRQVPGASYRSELWLGYSIDRQRHVFLEPGQYQICAEYDAFYGLGIHAVRTAPLRSNTVSVTVTRSDNPLDLQAWLVPAQVAMFHGGQDPFEMLRHGDPDSPYDHYARYALARNQALPLSERVTLLRQVTESPTAPPQLLDPARVLLRELAP